MERKETVQKIDSATSHRMLVVVIVGALLLVAGSSFAAEANDFIDALIGGKPTLNI